MKTQTQWLQEVELWEAGSERNAICPTINYNRSVFIGISFELMRILACKLKMHISKCDLAQAFCHSPHFIFDNNAIWSEQLLGGVRFIFRFFEFCIPSVNSGSSKSLSMQKSYCIRHMKNSVMSDIWWLLKMHCNSFAYPLHVRLEPKQFWLRNRWFESMHFSCNILSSI